MADEPDFQVSLSALAASAARSHLIRARVASGSAAQAAGSAASAMPSCCRPVSAKWAQRAPHWKPP